jgi:hypothetical protein
MVFVVQLVFVGSYSKVFRVLHLPAAKTADFYDDNRLRLVLSVTTD